MKAMDSRHDVVQPEVEGLPVAHGQKLRRVREEAVADVVPPFEELVHEEDQAEDERGRLVQDGPQGSFRLSAEMESTMVRLLVSRMTVLSAPRIRLISPAASWNSAVCICR